MSSPAFSPKPVSPFVAYLPSRIQVGHIFDFSVTGNGIGLACRSSLDLLDFEIAFKLAPCLIR